MSIVSKVLPKPRSASPDTADALIDSALDQNTGEPYDDNPTIAFDSKEIPLDYDPRSLIAEAALPQLHDGRDEIFFPKSYTLRHRPR
jgi:hypothetical protein